MSQQITDLMMDAVKEILAANPKCLLSGSLALKMQGVKTMREPKDIDIYMPYGLELILIPDMMYSSNADNADYPDDGWDRQEYTYRGFKVDVFTEDYEPIHRDGETIYMFNSTESKGINMVDKLDIIKFKASHSFGDHYTRYKHRNDIIYMMISN